MSADKPVANPQVVLREEFDDWAVLFDPDTAEGFAVNPVGVLIWKELDGNHDIADIVRVVREKCENVPEDVETHCREFVDSLIRKGLVGTEVTHD
ncbi:MAG: SynChlorMet cassette protein ScmD [Candidatus Aminicenantes bacterium]|nr:SynChlorMet cassette protein ScmD [Candidatus Aminicenantes bacterium]